MRFILKHIPVRWRLPFLAVSGILIGLILLLVYISNFFSYLSDRPETCMNCHVMGTEYVTWAKSAHRETATCNDCHVPQDNIFKTYYFKAMDGLRHATIFTMRAEPQAIIIKEEGKEAVQQNCIRCHSNVLQGVGMVNMGWKNNASLNDRNCWSCHASTPHGKVRSLASAPFARVPTTDSMIPEWLGDLLKKEDQKEEK